MRKETLILSSVMALAVASPSFSQTAAPVAAQTSTVPPPAGTQGAAPGVTGGDDLALKLANPVANLISVPLQNNIDYGIGQSDTYRYTLNVQPVIPFSVTDDWNMITRTIMPIVSTGSSAPGVDGATGFGDIVQSFFFSPKKPVGGMIIGVGPALMYATATDDILGTGKWAVGPTIVVLKQRGAVTVGALGNHLKAYAGDDSRDDVNATFINPFVSYITKSKTTLGIAPELTYDWKHEQWNLPFNFTVSQLLIVGKKPISVFGALRVYADPPEGGPEWGLRFGVTLLFPK